MAMLPLSTGIKRLQVRTMSSVIGHENLRHAVDLVFFEQWLRFYFIVEENGKLYIRMPAGELDKARSLHPELIAVADALNEREIDHQAAMDALCESMMTGPHALSGEQWAEVLSGKNFRLTLELLSFWVQADEAALDESPLAFHDWKKRFQAWCENPSIKDYVARLKCGSEAASTRVQ
jgi:hypothetical protein